MLVADSVRLKFKEFQDVNGGLTLDEIWKSDQDRMRWLKDVNDCLLRAEALSGGFGRIQLSLVPTRKSASNYVVPVGRADIGATRYSRPVFTFSALLTDLTTTAKDTAILETSGCQEQATGKAYTCAFIKIHYPLALKDSVVDSVRVIALLGLKQIDFRGAGIRSLMRDTTRRAVLPGGTP